MQRLCGSFLPKWSCYHMKLNVLQVLTEHEVMVENILWARVQLGILPKDNLGASYYLDLEPRRNKGVYLYGT